MLQNINCIVLCIYIKKKNFENKYYFFIKNKFVSIYLISIKRFYVMYGYFLCEEKPQKINK